MLFEKLINAVRELSVRRRRMDFDPVWKNATRTNTGKLQFRRSKFPCGEQNILYPADYKHKLIKRLRIKFSADEEEEMKNFVVMHRGTIASGEKAMKDAELRDSI
ncbi:hypothetical protein N7490_002150 [Penicillium lividum]|nr:hypothetical protein N7490_002150 [Penicillium lividum]